MENIAVQLAEGFEEIEAISIIDVLRRAGLNVHVISTTGDKEVKGSHNIRVIADQLFEDVDFTHIDMIVLPGGMPGALNLKNHSGLNEQILNFHKNGKPLGAICAAPMVLGNLDILKGESATCYPGFEEQLNGAHVSGEPIEVSGKIVTGKGAGVAIDFALKIVELLKGKDLAEELGKKMIVNTY